MNKIYTGRYGNSAGKPPGNGGMPMTNTFVPDVNISAGGTPYNGPITVQGDVTANLLVNPNLHQVRSNNTARAAQTKPIGMYTNTAEIDILQDELVFIQANEPTYSANAPTRDGPPLAFSSFTGIETGARFKNQVEFEQQFFCMGRAKTNYPFGNPQARREGVSVQVSGSFTTTNTGMHVFSAGDYVRVRPPQMDPTMREMESQMVHKNRNIPKSKHVAILERVQFADIHRLPNLALHHHMKKIADMKPNEREAYLNTDSTDALGDKALLPQERFALGAMHAEVTTGLLTCLSVLIEAGYLVLGDPGQDYNPANPPAPNSEDSLSTLSVILGVSPQGPGNTDVLLITEMLKRVNVGLMDRDMSHRERQALSIANNYPNSAVLKQAAKKQMNYARIKYGYFGDAYRAATNGIRFTVIRGASPGNKIDLLA